MGGRKKPLDVAPPSVGDLRPKGRGLDEDEKYNHWVKTRLREVWPLEKPMINLKFTLVFGLFSLIMIATPIYAQIIDQSLCVQCVTTAKAELNTCLEAAISQEDKKSCQEKRETRAKTCENECKIERAAANAIKHERQSAIKTPSE